MTELDWLAFTDVAALLKFLRDKTTPRKRHLYLCGGCRLISHLLYDDASAAMVEAAERYADGLATDEEMGRAAWAAECPTFGYDFDADFRGRHAGPEWADAKTRKVARLVACGALAPTALTGGDWRVSGPVRERLLAAARLAERCASDSFGEDGWWYSDFARTGWPGRALIDCVFGNPFRPVPADASWHSSTALAIARRMYDSRDFTPAPILADALQDAGCDTGTILTHLRGPGPHVRGCWVIDLLLGKA